MLWKRMTIRAKLYYGLKFYLHRNRWLLRRTQSLRAYLVLGLLRKPLVWFYQKYGNNEPLITDASRIFSDVDIDKVTSSLDNLGYSHVGILSQELVSQILNYCEVNKRVSHWNPHSDCESICSICYNSDIVEIARRYFGSEPILWLTRLKWSFPLSDDISDMQPSIHKEPIEYDPDRFHYDTHDFKSLTFFVYLTDVDDLDSGAHVVIEGTHKTKTLSEIMKITIEDRLAYLKYGERIKAILGKKGTVFAEESSAYHKIADCKERRLILMICYVLARKISPERPMTLSRSLVEHVLPGQ
jgi:hypothetical protein